MTILPNSRDYTPCGPTKTLSGTLLRGYLVQNPRMEQPLADVYFLVAMERIVGEKMAGMRLETALHKINMIREVRMWKYLDVRVCTAGTMHARLFKATGPWVAATALFLAMIMNL